MRLPPLYLEDALHSLCAAQFPELIHAAVFAQISYATPGLLTESSVCHRRIALLDVSASGLAQNPSDSSPKVCLEPRLPSKEGSGLTGLVVPAVPAVPSAESKG